jgi:hypothetical protein
MANLPITPDRIVQKHLPDYENRKSEYVRYYTTVMGLPEKEGADRFDFDMELFSEALAVRDAELLSRQRKICADSAALHWGLDSAIHDNVTIDRESILNAPTPELI